MTLSSLLTMASPSPWPRRLSSARAWQNGWVMVSSLLLGMPIPESSTASLTRNPSLSSSSLRSSKAT